MSLDEIGLRYGTDKASSFHNYLHRYEEIIPRMRPVRLLEIGWFDGASMRMWRDYLHEESTIIGVDIEPKEEIGGVQFIQANATTNELPYGLEFYAPGLRFDVIVDDGSHLSPDVITTLLLLWDRVRPGGYYIVEDLHVSYHKDWLGSDDGARPGPKGMTSMQFLKLVADDVHYGHAGAGPSQQRTLPGVGSIAFYPGLAIIRKKA